MVLGNYLKKVYAGVVFLALWSCSSKPENQTSQPQKETGNIAAEPVAATKIDTTQIPPNRLIVPGKSIGLTALQEKAEIVTARLGNPDQGDAAMGKALSTWFSKPTAHSSDTVRHQTTVYFKTNMGGADEASRVDQIRITSPYFITQDSIHVRSELAAIQEAYPALMKVAAYTIPQISAKIIIYDDAAAGIAFEINEQKRCIAIAVHAANQEIKDSYLPLFPEMEKF